MSSCQEGTSWLSEYSRFYFRIKIHPPRLLSSLGEGLCLPQNALLFREAKVTQSKGVGWCHTPGSDVKIKAEMSGFHPSVGSVLLSEVSL